MIPRPPHSITLSTQDVTASASASISVARLMAQLPSEWNTDFSLTGGTVALSIDAPDGRAVRLAVRKALTDPALRAWQLDE